MALYRYDTRLVEVLPGGALKIHGPGTAHGGYPKAPKRVREQIRERLGESAAMADALQRAKEGDPDAITQYAEERLSGGEPTVERSDQGGS